mgnify:CR=1 FL=1
MLILEVYPARRTAKNIKIFPVSSYIVAGRFLCSQAQAAYCHGSEHVQTALQYPDIVIKLRIQRHPDARFPLSEGGRGKRYLCSISLSNSFGNFFQNLIALWGILPRLDSWHSIKTLRGSA